MPDPKKGNTVYLKRIVSMFLIIAIFFLTFYISNLIQISRLKRLNEIFFVTSAGLANYTLTYNILREKIVNPNLEIFKRTDDLILDEGVTNIERINNDILTKHESNSELFTAFYMDLFLKLYHENLCFNVTNFSTLVQNCTTKANSISKFVILLNNNLKQTLKHIN